VQPRSDHHEEVRRLRAWSLERFGQAPPTPAHEEQMLQEATAPSVSRDKRRCSFHSNRRIEIPLTT
jgi:hypothetical protein